MTKISESQRWPEKGRGPENKATGFEGNKDLSYRSKEQLAANFIRILLLFLRNRAVPFWGVEWRSTQLKD